VSRTAEEHVDTASHAREEVVLLAVRIRLRAGNSV
jgi:hypothetical protein